jgi:hypothetical protein
MKLRGPRDDPRDPDLVHNLRLGTTDLEQGCEKYGH